MGLNDGFIVYGDFNGTIWENDRNKWNLRGLGNGGLMVLNVKFRLL